MSPRATPCGRGDRSRSQARTPRRLDRRRDSVASARLIPVSTASRTPFDSLDEVLAEWRPLASSDERHLRAIVDLLVEHLGPLHSIYLGQKNTVIGMSFGESHKVGLYVHRNRIDVAPDEVDALGGHVALARLCPGFVRAPGQRRRYARFEFSH